MLVKQFTIRAFEINIESQEEFLDFFTKNREIIQKYFLIINGKVTENIKKILKEEKILFTVGTLKNNSFVKNCHIQEIKAVEEKESKIFNFPIRSGMEIKSNSDIILLKRANSASSIQTDGNFIALDTVEGKVECNGEFMFLKASPKALILFNGKDISSYLQKNSFFSITFEEGNIEIKEFKRGNK